VNALHSLAFIAEALYPGAIVEAFAYADRIIEDGGYLKAGSDPRVIAQHSRFASKSRFCGREICRAGPDTWQGQTGRAIPGTRFVGGHV
jgi:hypothetical protein